MDLLVLCCWRQGLNFNGYNYYSYYYGLQQLSRVHANSQLMSILYFEISVDQVDFFHKYLTWAAIVMHATLRLITNT